MEKLHVSCFLFFYLCVERICGAAVAQRTVRPGENVILHCDLQTDVEWHRNCTHANQPTLTIHPTWAPPRFSVSKNSSTDSSDLRIDTITEGDLGLYYCSGIKNGGEVTGMIFKVLFEATLPSLTPPNDPPPDCGPSWTLLVVLCSTCTVTTAVVSITGVCCLLRRKGLTDKELYQECTYRTKGQKQDEDLWYSSLDNSQKSRPMKERRQESPHQMHSDFSMYSEVRAGTE